VRREAPPIPPSSFRTPNSNQALLRHARHEAAAAVVERAAREAQGAGGAGALHGVEVPGARAEGAVEPDRVVEAGGLDLGLEVRAPVWEEGGAEEAVDRGVSHDGLLHERPAR